MSSDNLTGHRRFTDVTEYDMYDEENQTYTALYGLRFYRTMRLTQENHEIHLIDLLDDKAAWFAFGKLSTHLNSSNQIVIDKGLSRSHWKLAKTQKDLMAICGINSKGTWGKVKSLFDQHDVIAKSEICGRTSYLLNPLYCTAGNKLPLQLINAFWPSIRKQVRSTQTIRELDHLLSELNNPANVNKIADTQEEVEEILNGDLTDEAIALDKDVIFRQYILRNQTPVIYHEFHFNKDGKDRTFIKDGENVYHTNEFFAVNVFTGSSRKAENITAIRSIFCDIDAGKDAQGHYLSMDEVQKRKAAMWDIIHTALPCPTAIVDTRNGFHVYWSIAEADQSNVERGRNLLKKLVSSISIADQAVSDIPRILRRPGSRHLKAGLAPYDVTIAEATPVEYTMDQIEQILDNTAEKIAAACQAYSEAYPDYYAQAKAESKAKKVAHNKVIPMPRRKAMAVNGTIAYSEAVDYIKTHVDMKEYLTSLGFECTGTKFCCVLPEHDDHTGDAVIYTANGVSQPYDVYVCHCTDNRGLDIIGLVQKMYGYSFGQALKELARYLDVRIVKDNNVA
ncbi:MAG: hypothetical protein K6C05_08250 [Anaerovibrio sp.]|uniref:DNA-primase RepB domain-containing protein n=1 Tax=Anaerovibrio sp. TaxID=1872532 RepID=UPI0025CF81D8|nr:DNA-primase RepB domain-containing protein [Anaerovibrio sp.]MCR5176827.1 hypothetical protein [Anaerovibrio sp.]